MMAMRCLAAAPFVLCRTNRQQQKNNAKNPIDMCRWDFLFGGEGGILNPGFAPRLYTSKCLHAKPGLFLRNSEGSSFVIFAKKNKASPKGTLFFWRRRRDSNPRTAVNGYTISNRARSTSYATSPSMFCALSKR